MTARYRQIAAELRETIESGHYGPGVMLPGLAELASQYDATKSTVNGALKLLETEGLVRAYPGRGTVVMDRRAVPVSLSRYASVLAPGGSLGPWETACQQAGLNGSMVLVDVGQEPAAPEVAVALEIEVGAPTVRRDRHATIDGVPVQLHTAWYPGALASDTPLAGTDKITGGVYGALTAVGHPPLTADETVFCRPGTAEEAIELDLRGGPAAVIAVERVTRDAQRIPLEFLRVVADPARTTLVYDGLPLARDPQTGRRSEGVP